MRFGSTLIILTLLSLSPMARADAESIPHYRPDDVEISLTDENTPRSATDAHKCLEVVIRSGDSYAIEKVIYPHGTVHEKTYWFRVSGSELDRLYRILTDNRFDTIKTSERDERRIDRQKRVSVFSGQVEISKSDTRHESINWLSRSRFDRVVEAITLLAQKKVRNNGRAPIRG